MSSSLILSRRSIIAAAAFAALSPLTARSQPRSPFHRFDVGSFTATIVSEGTLKLHPPKQVLLDAPEGDITAALTAADQPTDFLRVEQNVLVLDTGNARLLFDTGSGSKKLYGEDSGQLLTNLEAAGVAPSSVTGVALTHAHFDHLWGVSTPDGRPNFPNAQIYIADTEYAYWTADARSANDTQAAGVKRHLVPLRDRVVELRDGQEVVTGVQAVRTPGHTPGHTSYLISSGNDSYLLLGDAAFHAPLSLIFPTSRSLYDVDLQVGIATRKLVIEQVTSERQAIIAYHYPWPGVGRIEKSGQAHRFVPV